MIALQNVLPFFLIMAALVFVGGAIARLPFYEKYLQGQKLGRYGTLDGLRGFLALSVFLHHCVIQWAVMHGESWHRPLSHFYAMAGPVPVQVFFMITGFLFWTKAIDSGARMDPSSLLRSRFFRIAPQYLFTSLVVITLVLIETRFQLRVPMSDIGKSLARAGLVGLAQIREFNGVQTLQHTGNVAWTLRFEWCFYLSLLVIAWFARPWRFGALVAAFVALHFFFPRLFLESFFFFIPGMLAAHLRQAVPSVKWVESPWFGIVPVALAAVVFSVKMAPLVEGLCFVAPMFLCFVYGNDLFGLLKTPGAQVLGAASYSIYLMHPPILYTVVHLADKLAPIRTMAEWQYWIVCTLAGVAVVALSTLTFASVEYPFMSMGRRKRAVVEVRQQVPA